MTMRSLASVPVILIHPNSAQVGERVRPVSLSAHRNFQNELAYAQTILAPIMQKHDLLEPFERLRLGLVEVHKVGLGEVVKNA